VLFFTDVVDFALLVMSVGMFVIVYNAHAVPGEMNRISMVCA